MNNERKIVNLVNERSDIFENVKVKNTGFLTYVTARIRGEKRVSFKIHKNKICFCLGKNNSVVLFFNDFNIIENDNGVILSVNKKILFFKFNIGFVKLL